MLDRVFLKWKAYVYFTFYTYINIGLSLFKIKQYKLLS